LKQSLTALLEEGQQDIAKFEASLEGWFNNQMDRVRGWYKRKVQVVVFAVSMLVAVGSNADSIVIARTLSSNVVLRAALVEQAQDIVKRPLDKPSPADQAKGATSNPSEEIQSRLSAVERGIEKVQGLGLAVSFGWVRDIPSDFHWPEAIAGWLVTAFAISLGAPFWFDMLSKIMSIRASGKTPAEPGGA